MAHTFGYLRRKRLFSVLLYWHVLQYKAVTLYFQSYKRLNFI